jgi:hypothetical protein
MRPVDRPLPGSGWRCVVRSRQAGDGSRWVTVTRLADRVGGRAGTVAFSDRPTRDGHTYPVGAELAIHGGDLARRIFGDESSVKGKPAYVVASRGGSYTPGTPREHYKYVHNYLQAILRDVLGMQVDFIVPELTMARANPAMAKLIPLAEASKAKAHHNACDVGSHGCRSRCSTGSSLLNTAPPQLSLLGIRPTQHRLWDNALSSCCAGAKP